MTYESYWDKRRRLEGERKEKESKYDNERRIEELEEKENKD